MPCIWDSAHLMQLAEGSARNEEASAWVRQTIEDITRMNKSGSGTATGSNSCDLKRVIAALV